MLFYYFSAGYEEKMQCLGKSLASHHTSCCAAITQNLPCAYAINTIDNIELFAEISETLSSVYCTCGSS